MKIALVGASGAAGSRILAELSQRGHAITAIARQPERAAVLPGITAVAGDAGEPAALAALLRGHDVVITSIHFTASDPHKLIAAVTLAEVPRYLVVGGAGSLEVAPGVALYDTPDFPAIYSAEAKAGGAFLELLKAQTQLDWTFLSPAAMFIPGSRTGVFRIGGDQLLVAADGQSVISFEDYAVALADEVETPRHRRQRFTVGY